MHWQDWLQILRWRSLEEGDSEGLLLSEDRRREATAHTKAGLSTGEVTADPISTREKNFLLKRSQWLSHELLGCNGSLVRLMERLEVLQSRRGWVLLGWLLAFLVGYELAGLGQEAEMNLLALPLLGILIWNWAMMLASLWLEWKREKANPTLKNLAKWISHPNSDKSWGDADPPTGMTVEQRFHQMVDDLCLCRWQKRLRAWLHVAAALLALGSAVALYARGWSREYRAVWESTLLDSTKTQIFLGTLFQPAATVLRRPIPLADVPTMQRKVGASYQSAPALEWIHLYAGTLLLGVCLPRCLLALFTSMRATQRAKQQILSLGWQHYLQRLLRGVEGGQEEIPVIIHGSTSTRPSHLEVWARGVRENFGHLIQPNYLHLPLGDEDDFVQSWKAKSPNLVLIFNLATTPENEVHQQLSLDLASKLRAQHREGRLLILLDATSVAGRWSPEKTQQRERLWTELLQPSGAEILVATQRPNAHPDQS